MKKDYTLWHDEKKRINDMKGSAFFHEREVWWCALGANVGFEQDGGSEQFTRPVVILTKFNLDVCLIVPLTARSKQGMYYYNVGKVDGRDAIAVLSQIRLIDRKRLQLKIETLPQSIYDDLVREVVSACFPNLKP